MAMSKEERRERKNEQSRRYRAANHERRLQLEREWREANREKRRQYRRELYAADREAAARYQREWRKANPEKYQAHIARRDRLPITLRSRLYAAIRHEFKTGSAVRDLGCTISELRAHLETRFLPGMTWENWSLRGWHIDHIIPLSSFDLSDPEQFAKAVHYTNLRPLWATDNLSKGARVERDR